MATYTPTKLIGPNQLTVITETTLYTVPALTNVIVKEIVIVNTSASGITVGVSIVDVAHVAGAANRILPDQVLPAGSTTILDLAIVMTAGDFISAKAGTVSVVNIFAAGVAIV